ncbi:DUF3558 family protein [Actinokineospora sp. G85]|uniref:DUF3558 family protein n=1 Tax=Actinokineospora sp. G85 TaxID=3406626 RepID=UPI003C75E7C2
MTTRATRTALAALAAPALALVLASGCSTEDPSGPPQPTPIGDGPLATADPCGLLPASAVSTAGLERSTPDAVPNAHPSNFRDCGWRHATDGKTDYQLTVGIVADPTYPQVPEGDAFAVDQYRSAGRDGTRLKYTEVDGCQFVTDTSPRERVMVLVVALTGGVEQACTLLEKHAAEVVRALPGGV